MPRRTINIQIVAGRKHVEGANCCEWAVSRNNIVRRINKKLAELGLTMKTAHGQRLTVRQSYPSSEGNLHLPMTLKSRFTLLGHRAIHKVESPYAVNRPTCGLVLSVS